MDEVEIRRRRELAVAELQDETVAYLRSQDRTDGVPIYDVMRHLRALTTDTAAISRAMCSGAGRFHVGMDRHVRLT